MNSYFKCDLPFLRAQFSELRQTYLQTFYNHNRGNIPIAWNVPGFSLAVSPHPCSPVPGKPWSDASSCNFAVFRVTWNQGCTHFVVRVWCFFHHCSAEIPTLSLTRGYRCAMVGLSTRKLVDAVFFSILWWRWLNQLYIITHRYVFLGLHFAWINTYVEIAGPYDSSCFVTEETPTVFKVCRTICVYINDV